MKLTSAYANKLLTQLKEEKKYWLEREQEANFYVCADGEEAVIPEYDYEAVAATLAEIDRKTCAIKHALNLSNVNAQITVGDKVMSVDEILVQMAQLNSRKSMLDFMRKRLPKERLGQRSISASRNVPEYRYINYDIATVQKDFESIDQQIMEMQIALDIHNQTVVFEVEI